jgi:PmbA protein
VTELLDLARAVAGWAGAGEDVEVFATRSKRTGVRAYHGDVESVSSAEPAGVGIRVLVGGRQGFASAGTLDEIVLKETLEEARDNASFAAPDEFVALATPDGTPVPELKVCREDLVSVPITDKVELAIELERRALAADAAVSGVRVAAYGDAIAEEAVVTTTGIATSFRVSSAHLSVETLVERAGDTQIADGRSVGRHPDELDVEAAATEAATRACRLLGATQPLSRRVTAVLDPEVSAALISIVGSTLSGEAVLKGRSLFAGRVGQAVAAATVTLVDDPTDPSSLGAEPYDGEGLARRRNVLVNGGVLQGFLYNSYAARRAGTRSTGSAARGYASTPGIGAPALRVLPGRRTPAELLALVGEGIYVQSVSGLHSGVNPVSGDFSVGATGLLIEGGALGRPFREATVASTLQRMLLEVVEVGNDLRWFGAGAAGVTLVISDLSLGGMSAP